MHDGAPGHASGHTYEELVNRGIKLIFLPPISPDFNPIETVWNIMKDWIQDRNEEEKLKLPSITTSGHRVLGSCGSGSARRPY